MGEKERVKEECPEILGTEVGMADEVATPPTPGAEEEGHIAVEEECLATTEVEVAMGGKATSVGMVRGAVEGRQPQCSFPQLSR